jgi:PTH1 family peptidyl-tRNA hydrolase
MCKGMKLIVGLGNPGSQYERTRHNIGFLIIDYLAERWNIKMNQSKYNGLYGTGTVNGEKVVLLKPLTYMNLSGEAIAPLARFYKIDLNDIAIIYDDLDLPRGKVRLRQKGSAGGHNGMKSTIQHLGGDGFNRIRVGIGRPEGRIPVPDYVLTNFKDDEWEVMKEAIDKSLKVCDQWLNEPFLKVMNSFNGQ